MFPLCPVFRLIQVSRIEGYETSQMCGKPSQRLAYTNSAIYSDWNKKYGARSFLRSGPYWAKFAHVIANVRPAMQCYLPARARAIYLTSAELNSSTAEHQKDTRQTIIFAVSTLAPTTNITIPPHTDSLPFTFVHPCQYTHVVSYVFNQPTRPPPPSWRNSPPVGQGLLIIEASRSQTHHTL